MIPFPNINPVAFSIGGVDVYWYGIAYAIGIMLAFYMLKVLNANSDPCVFNNAALDAFILYAVIGIIVGGRVGYIIFYHPSWILSEPLRLFKIREGGMSFHGGLIGTIIALCLLCRKYKLKFWSAADMVVCIVPIGISLGRMANFVNAELVGKVSNAPWAVIFPQQGDVSRHPSQLYEGLTEGILLLIIMLRLYTVPSIRNRRCCLSGIFLASYGIIRLVMEVFREPEVVFCALGVDVSMGQMLSFPMVVIGILLVIYGDRFFHT